MASKHYFFALNLVCGGTSKGNVLNVNVVDIAISTTKALMRQVSILVDEIDGTPV